MAARNLLLPFLCLLLVQSCCLAASTKFTNAHMAPKGRQSSSVGTDVDAPVLHAITEVAVVEETTPWVEAVDQVSEITKDEEMSVLPATEQIIAEVVEEPNPIKLKTHEELIADELQRRAEEELIREEELLKRGEVEQMRKEEELKRREEEQVRRDEEIKRREQAEILVQEELKRRAEAEVLVQEELKRRAEAEVLVQEELKRRAEAEALVQEELKRRAEAEALVQEELKRREEAEVLVQEELKRRELEEDKRGEENQRRKFVGGQRRTGIERDSSRFKRQHEVSSQHEALQTEIPATVVHQANLDRKKEIETQNLNEGLQHEAAGLDQHQMEAQEHSQFTRNQEELIRQQEIERQRQEAERLELEEHRSEVSTQDPLTSLDESFQTEIPAAVIHQQNLDTKEQIESQNQEHGVRHETAGLEQHQKEAQDHSQFSSNQEELIRQQEIERQRQEAERSEQEELRMKAEVQSTDSSSDMTFQTEIPAEIVHQENLNRKEQIEIKNLEEGLQHEVAGQDQHQREAYEHLQVSSTQEEFIRQQEIERQRQEAERLELEEIRIKAEKERQAKDEQLSQVNLEANRQSSNSGVAVSGAQYLDNGATQASLECFMLPLLLVSKFFF